MRRMMVAGNWKMNCLQAAAAALSRAIEHGCENVEVGLFPPFTALHVLRDTIGGSAIALGAQNCHAQESGAFTGDISAAMLADAGCEYVILGHSERRHGAGESSADVKAKAAAAVSAGLRPVICIGETEGERDAGQAGAVVTGQLDESLCDGLSAQNCVIAYEPVWAIGTGKVATIDDIATMHSAVRERLGNYGLGEARILYGGSVKPDNAAAIMELADVDGVLVGGASLKADDFNAISAAARACAAKKA